MTVNHALHVVDARRNHFDARRDGVQTLLRIAQRFRVLFKVDEFALGSAKRVECYVASSERASVSIERDNNNKQTNRQTNKKTNKQTNKQKQKQKQNTQPRTNPKKSNVLKTQMQKIITTTQNQTSKANSTQWRRHSQFLFYFWFCVCVSCVCEDDSIAKLCHCIRLLCRRRRGASGRSALARRATLRHARVTFRLLLGNARFHQLGCK